MVNPGDHLEFTVLGRCQGQDFINTFNYFVNPANATSNPIGTWLDEFRDNWRAQWIARASRLYQVNYYIGRKLGTMVYLPVTPPASPTSRPAMRYAEQLIYVGDSNDIGDVADDLVQPTFNSLGIYKQTSIVTDPDNFALPGEKLIKGSNRIGPVLESDTILAKPNELDPDRRTLYQTAFANFLELAVGANNINMEVLSFYKNGVHRDTGGVPTFARSQVQQLIVSLYVTSQVTRKQGNRTAG